MAELMFEVGDKVTAYVATPGQYAPSMHQGVIRAAFPDKAFPDNTAYDVELDGSGFNTRLNERYLQADPTASLGNAPYGGR